MSVLTPSQFRETKMTLQSSIAMKICQEINEGLLVGKTTIHTSLEQVYYQNAKYYALHDFEDDIVDGIRALVAQRLDTRGWTLVSFEWSPHGSPAWWLTIEEK